MILQTPTPHNTITNTCTKEAHCIEKLKHTGKYFTLV